VGKGELGNGFYFCFLQTETKIKKSNFITFFWAYNSIIIDYYIMFPFTRDGKVQKNYSTLNGD
jgi:hypothetical protein